MILKNPYKSKGQDPDVAAIFTRHVTNTLVSSNSYVQYSRTYHLEHVQL
jgi:hypothetical protein